MSMHDDYDYYFDPDYDGDGDGLSGDPEGELDLHGGIATGRPIVDYDETDL